MKEPSITRHLRKEIQAPVAGRFAPHVFRAAGLEHTGAPTDAERRADGILALFALPEPHLYDNDWIAGSIRPLWTMADDAADQHARDVLAACPERGFLSNADHFAPDYRTALALGVPGLIQQVDGSLSDHHGQPEKTAMLRAMRAALTGLGDRLLAHADACSARSARSPSGTDHRLAFIEDNCRSLAFHAPASFAQALQLVWMIHTCFVYEGRYAMALGRMDQYLYPFYERDIAQGALTPAFAAQLLENVFIKIHERRALLHADDVVNICIGGMNQRGENQANALSFLILHAVAACRVPGPNLSARIAPCTPDAFLDECLAVIGTGLGYPALMNDTVNIAALRRYGYEEADLFDYSMVGCIENFMTGKQPPWSDGRFDTPRYFEYLFNEGISFDAKTRGLDTGRVEDIASMAAFMDRFEQQLAFGVGEYVQDFLKKNILPEGDRRPSPFLSCFCADCIARGLDINQGGSVYPSVHGAALMGVGTVSDALAAVERVVFEDRRLTLGELGDALKNNFEGRDDVRTLLLDAPKYGNNDPFADKYAVWFVDFLADAFSKYQTPDGGGIYVAMAANTSNIHAGRLIGATPDGRKAGQPLSDAASPSYGRDVNGPTAVVHSITRPDYTRVACGTVINQKFSPDMFQGDKRAKLLRLIRVYFDKGGQELQINATLPQTLRDAMAHPEEHRDLVVRVSGFSAFFVTLETAVKQDILQRTQQG